MPTCLMCGEEIPPELDSREHLIPEAIGGRRQISGLLHRKCNSDAGVWDAELARQLHPLSVMFEINRQRGKTPPIRAVTTADEHITIWPDGTLMHTRPIVERTLMDDGAVNYHIKARTEAEARSLIRDLKRKFPQLDEGAVFGQVESQDSYLAGTVIHNLGIGGEIAGRSIVKSCAAMAAYSGIDWSRCTQAIAYIRNSDARPCFGYYNQKDLVSGRVDGTPMHCLGVSADPSSGLILAYAEYFGLHRAVACLGEGYDGPPIRAAYALDPIDGSELAVEVALPFSRSDINEIYEYRRYDPALMKASGDAVLGPLMRRNYDRERERAIGRGVDRGFRECGAKEGDFLTEEHVQFIARCVADEMARFLLHVRPERRPTPATPRARPPEP